MKISVHLLRSPWCSTVTAWQGACSQQGVTFVSQAFIKLTRSTAWNFKSVRISNYQEGNKIFLVNSNVPFFNELSKYCALNFNVWIKSPLMTRLFKVSICVCAFIIQKCRICLFHTANLSCQKLSGNTYVPEGGNEGAKPLPLEFQYLIILI